MVVDASISRRRLLAAVPAWMAARRLGAQTQQEKPTYTANVKVVSLYANVRDKNGGIVKDLKKDDFLLEEDARPQTITYFSRESDLPLTLGLLVDTSQSQRRMIGEERSASYKFFEQVLRPEKDVAFVIHFDYEIELLQDVTGDRRLLEKALNDLQVATRQSGGQGGQPGQQAPYPYPTTPYPIPGGGRQKRTGPVGPPVGGGAGSRRFGIGTDLYDAILLASDEIMRKQQGRKALILLTDGVDFGSKTTLSSAIEAAQRADALVYSVLFADPETYGNRGLVSGRIGRRGNRGGMGPADGKKALGQIARETGGRFFEVSKKRTLAMVYDAIDVDLRHQYSIGYTPDRGENSPYYHKIKLTAKQKGYTVQAREGYYGN